jgi:mRNA-degrading endonuclease toxin of MazEF toxin-antitoxin module
MRIEYGRIVLVPIAAGHGNTKRHPAVIVSPNDEIRSGADLLVVAVSTQIEEPRPSYHVPLPWQRPRHPRTGLNKPNVAKCNWFAKVDPGAVIKILGFVPSPELARIEEELRKLRADSNG